MARNSQTFNASIRLNTSQFKKGVSEVQKSLKTLQRSFLSLAGALGIGLSFQRLGSTLLDTATKLSTAKNVLENVSKEVGEYGQNLEWLRRISNEYGQDMITLINSFAQFRAAAATSNLTLEQMRTIYESLTRAAGAFHLSADRTNDMMMAVTQMLSKGKVAAEELRRQLGNVLPGAFNLMAQAAYNAGIITENSTAALEDAMKKGKVVAEQVLPEFAKQLDVVTEGANFESLQSSINRLKNSWTEMVDNANFEGMYKGIIDGANKVVQYFSSGFWTKISSTIAGIFGGTVVAGGMRKFMAGARELARTSQAEFNKVYATVDKLEGEFDKLNKKYSLGGAFVHKRGMRSTNPAVHGNISYLEMGPQDEDFMRNMGVTEKELKNLRKQVLEYNNALLKLNETSKSGGAKPLFSEKDANRLRAYNKQLNDVIVTSESGHDAFNRLNKETSLMGPVISKLTAAWKVFTSVLKTALSSMAIGAVISAITYVIGKLVEIRKEEKRIAGIADEMVDSINKASGAENKQLVRLTNIQRAWERIGQSSDEANSAQKASLINQINEALGKTGENLLTVESGYDAVNKELTTYIDNIKKAARQQAILSLVNEKTAKVIQLEAENVGYTQDPNYGKKRTYRGDSGQWEGFTPEAAELNSNISKNNREIAALNEGIERILKMADKDTLDALYGGKEETGGGNGGGNSGGGGDTGGTNTKKDTPQTELNKYKEELKKLENQYKAGAILAEDYKKKVEELNQKTFEELSSFGWENAIKGLKTSADKALAEGIKSTATAKLLEGLDDPEEIAEFDKSMQEEADNALKKFREAWDKFLEYKKKRPLISKVDTSDGYMYSRKRGNGQTYSEYETHYNSEYLDAYQNYVDDLESYKRDLQEAMKEMTDPASIKRMNELLQETIDKLELAKLTVKDLKTKANIAEIEKDIADLKKEGIEGIFSSITSVADGMDRLYRAVQSLQQINDKTWKDEDLENFLTGLNAIIQAFEVMKSIIEAVSAVTKVYAQIKEKESAKAIALNKLEATSEAEKAAAAAGAAAAGAASSTAGIPIIGPVLAVAAVASVVAAILAGMKKFATGGIMGGNSYAGDKNIARVNSGEMVITRGQQARLWDFIQGGSKGNNMSGEVQFKIRGTDLIGAINNEMSRRRG